jgi:AraC-like DNA-binding protein
MEQVSSVGAGYVSGLFDAAQRAGLSREKLLGHAGLLAVDSPHSHGRMPMADVIRLFESAVALTRRVDLGLEFARQVRPGTFNVLGYALMTCKTLGEAIALVPHYRRLVFDIGYSEMHFVATTKDARLGWQVVSHALPYCAPLAESLIASWYTFGRWIAGVELPLNEVVFVHSAPANTAKYTEFFDCPVRFGAGENALVFDRSLLDMPLVQADETLHLAMREQARTAMEATFKDHGLAYRLRQALIPLMPKCEATLEKAADRLAMSPRSLQRKLADAQLNFQTVLDAVRKDLARVYLRDPALSALDIALLLGYAEQSSFTRAFKSWFATTPSAWRSPVLRP